VPGQEKQHNIIKKKKTKTLKHIKTVKHLQIVSSSNSSLRKDLKILIDTRICNFKSFCKKFQSLGAAYQKACFFGRVEMERVCKFMWAQRTNSNRFVLGI